MNKGWVLILTLVFCANTLAQAELQPMFDAERVFQRTAAEAGVKSAFLAVLADDAIVFRPHAVNGRQFWQTTDGPSDVSLVRKMTFADISANGLLGYTTGTWRLYRKGKSDGLAEFGQYVTIWEKKPDGKFRATLDIGTRHEKLPFYETDRQYRTKNKKDLNKRGWSPADDSMNFLRMSMSNKALGGAYAKYAAEDVRILRDGAPPIGGRKNVVREMKQYVAVEFPKSVASFQAADMAYFWNPCEFASNNEGMEKGHCLHIWKLRNKRWLIVLGVFARVPNDTPPKLQIRQRERNTR